MLLINKGGRWGEKKVLIDISIASIAFIPVVSIITNIIMNRD